MEHFGQLRDMIDVERPHELIRMAIDLKNNSQTAEAEAAYRQVDAISSVIVSHLDDAEQRLQLYNLFKSKTYSVITYCLLNKKYYFYY